MYIEISTIVYFAKVESYLQPFIYFIKKKIQNILHINIGL